MADKREGVTMCGRYYFDVLKSKRLQKLVNLLKEAGINVKTGEVFPNDVTAVINASHQKTQLSGIKWGLDGFRENQLIINARAESVTDKKMFRTPFLTNRCLFPMSGFYEWNPAKDKFYFTYPDDQLIFVGGFIRNEQDGPRSIIMTTEPNQNVSPIHNRMPVLIGEKDIKQWLFDNDFARGLIQHQMPALSVTKVPK